MQSIINVIVFVLVLGSIIFIHELGHFLAAKKFGVYCDEFALGMGPTIFSVKGKETKYSLKLLPIGGFVAMAGEADQQDNPNMVDLPRERTIPGIKTWQQVVVMLAGVVMNFVLAIVILLGVNFTQGRMPTNDNVIGTVVAGYPAEKVGMQEGDEIISIKVFSGKEFIINEFSDISNALSVENAGEFSSSDESRVVIKVLRGENKQEIEFVAQAVRPDGSDKYLLGINNTYRHMSISEAFKYTGEELVEMSTAIFGTLGRMFTDKTVFSQLSGPVGIFNITSEVAEQGNVSNILLLIAMLSINVGVFNLLPIPGLDGAQVLFALIEKGMGKPVPVKVRYVVQTIGLCLVFGLMIFVSINDITRLFK